MLYEVAILEKPTKKEAEEGQVEKLVYGPDPIVAANEQAAAIVASRNIDSSFNLKDADMNRLEVIVRPFVE